MLALGREIKTELSTGMDRLILSFSAPGETVLLLREPQHGLAQKGP